jgi:hypothetical protein
MPSLKPKPPPDPQAVTKISAIGPVIIHSGSVYGGTDFLLKTGFSIGPEGKGIETRRGNGPRRRGRRLGQAQNFRPKAPASPLIGSG